MATTKIDELLGKGIVFPFIIDANGRVPIESGVNLIRASLITILSWANFRFFLGDFRSRIFELLEEPNDIIVRGLVRDFSIDQITQWETRVRLIDAQLIQNDTIDGRFDLKLKYEIIASKVEDSFIFPFYDKITN